MNKLEFECIIGIYFIDRKKAESYCKQFDEKKNEYSRYYE